MPSPIAHGSLTLLALPALGLGPHSGTLSGPRRLLLVGALLAASIAPDLDIAAGWILTGDAFKHHGHQSHSVLLAPLFGLVFAPALRLLGVPVPWGRAWAVGASLWAAHVLMDLLTHGSRGVGLLWPIVPQRIASPLSLFVGVEHGRWWLWHKHLLTIANESAFALLIQALRLEFTRRPTGANNTHDHNQQP